MDKIQSEVEVEAEKYSFEEIFEYLACGQYPAGVDKNYTHGLCKRSKFFIHEEGRLYYLGGRGKLANAGAAERRLVVMDTGERMRIVSSVHDNAHLGRDKTLAQINSKYYWPDMYKDICAYINSCDRCQRVNGKLRKEHAALHPVQEKDEAWAQVGMDLVGPLPETPRGHKYIMTLTDYYTKWAEAYPISDKTAASVAVAKISPFPAKMVRRGHKVKRVDSIRVFCLCCTQEGGRMVQCASCCEWYHDERVEVPEEAWEQLEYSWLCKNCC